MENLAKALVAFHKDPPRIALDGHNPHFNSKFATLAGVSKAVGERLAACGIVYLQEPCVLDGGMPGLRTTLLHVSGESTSAVMPLALNKPGPQALGSALTYARRYALLGVLGLVGDEDDDGNAAQKATASPTAEGRGTGEAAVQPQSVNSDKVATDPQRKKIAVMANNLDIPMADESRVNLIAAVEDPNLTRDKAHELIEWLTKREKEAVPF